MAKPRGKKLHDWDSVFSQCANCGHEIHRSKGRHSAWLHANSSPWCPKPFEPEVKETDSPDQ